MSTPPATRDRVELVARRFERRFGRRPEVVVRAPGRVNLIGEHTDYNGLPVLPIAIDRCVLVAAARRPDRRVELANADERFAAHSYQLRARLRRFAAGDWGNYHKAAAQGLLAAVGEDVLRGGAFLVDGNIPTGAGLSSSSALVVGSALAFLAINDRSMPPLALAELSATAERYVGTQSGGMDQAVCLLARRQHALRIDFHPLRCRPVPLPADHVFVVCHSLVDAQKSGAAQAAYNQRVIECRLACQVLERMLGSRLPRPLAQLGDLRLLFAERELSDFVAMLESALPPRPLHLEEVADLVGAPVAHLAQRVGGRLRRDLTYPLLRRARHVLTEAERVERAEATLTSGDWLGLSALMDASHASCRDDFEVSCPELEELVSAAKEAGALGARLTGAGFGGCTVNLVPAADVSLFLSLIERRYYHARSPRGREHCFPVAASAGAEVLRP